MHDDYISSDENYYEYFDRIDNDMMKHSVLKRIQDKEEALAIKKEALDIKEKKIKAREDDVQSREDNVQLREDNLKTREETLKARDDNQLLVMKKTICDFVREKFNQNISSYLETLTYDQVFDLMSNMYYIQQFDKIITK